jgi:hypothetical protein
MNILNRQTGGDVQFLHTQVLCPNPETPGTVQNCDEVELIGQAATLAKNNIARSLARYQAYPHFQYHQHTLKCVVVPVHVSKNHWLLAVVNFKEQKYEVWDSLPRRTLFGYKKIVRLMALLRNEVAREDLPDWEVDIWRGVVQRGIDDCGVFVCRFATAYARGEPASDVSRAEVQDNAAFREEMLIALCRGSVEGVLVW